MQQAKGAAGDAVRTTTQRLVRYDTAQFAIDLMIALRSAWIHEEESEANPDHAQVATWEAERSRLIDERHELAFNDDEEVDRVIAKYGPVVKAAYAA